MSSEPVRSYLLGILEAHEAASVEERYFTDREFFLFVQAVETTLIEDYLSDRLAPSIRSRFEARYLSTPDLRRRLEEVRARQVLAQASGWQMDRPRVLLVAAMLLVCVGGAVLWLYRDVLRFEAVPPSTDARPILATLSLSPGVLKGAGAGELKLGPPSRPGNVLLVLELPGQRTQILCSAQLSLALPDGAWRRVWFSPQPVRSSPSEGGQRLPLILDSSLLRRGDYLVQLVGADAQVQETYVFRVSPM